MYRLKWECDKCNFFYSSGLNMSRRQEDWRQEQNAAEVRQTRPGSHYENRVRGGDLSRTLQIVPSNGAVHAQR